MSSSTESHAAGAEPTLPRARWLGPGGPTSGPRGPRVYTQAGRWLPVVILLAVATVASAVFASKVATRSYPTAPALVGTRSAENIRSPRDLTVVDGATTERLRQQAEARVRRIYDFDAALGTRLSERLAQAFAEARRLLESARPDGEAEQPESAPAHALVSEETLSQAQSALEKALGITLKAEEAKLLSASHYDAELAKAIGEVLADVGSSPLVANRDNLEPDREQGITVQRVPSEGHADRIMGSIEAIADLDELRRALPARVARLLPEADAQEQSLIVGLVRRLAQPNLTLNRAATERAREAARSSVEPVTVSVKKGEMVIRQGEAFNPRHLLVLRELERRTGWLSVVVAAAGGGLLILVLLLTGLGVGKGHSWRGELRPRDMLFLLLLFALVLALMQLWQAVALAMHEAFPLVPLQAFLFLAPVAAATIMARLVLRVETALLFGAVTSLASGLAIDAEPLYLFFCLAGSVLGVSTIGNITARGNLVRAGLWVGAGQAAAAFAIRLFEAHTDWAGYAVTLSAAFVGGVAAALLVLGLAPVVEVLFGYTTDLKLLELANLNHPALKELIVQAPGSYHHSIIVGALVEAAAEAIGANPLLARVMAYYHDLGKGANPSYFIENQRGGKNPHDKLKPSMSAIIIRRHVMEGVELAKRYKLADPIVDAIVEHHGSTLIHYFYQKAKEQEGEDNPVADSDYRYPGRKPQSRETALVMLGDAVEAAARSLTEPTAARLQGLVTRIINLKFTDGQLEECDLTLKDLHTIARAFSYVLTSIYHERPEYPGLLTDIQGKKATDDDSDSKPGSRPDHPEDPDPEDRPDRLRRLGLS